MYERLGLFIDGTWIDERERGEDVLNPATEQPLARLPHATPEDLDRALATAQRAFPGWRAMPALERGRILERTAALLREREEALARTLTLEEGKPLREARLEVRFAADVFDWYAEEGKRAYGRVIPARSPGVLQIAVREPVGPAAAFTPWNFPATTPARKIAGALAGGCTLIIKASEETPGTCVAIVRALEEAGAPAGVVNLVFGVPAEVSSHIIPSPVIRKVSFTGSIPVGKELARLAAGGMKRCTMELGGHAPVIVFPDADPERAAEVAAAGKFRNAGQVCIAPTRMYVHRSLHDRFVARFVEIAEGLNVGDGLDEASDMGPLANARRVSAMETFVADARERGAEIVTGGARIGNQGYFFAPTVITGIDDGALVMRQEPFGPIAPIAPFADFDEVVARANALEYGLAAYAFTGSAKTATEIAGALESGMVGINHLGISMPETPFGGVKESGYGHEGGIEGLEAYTNVKFVTHLGV